MKFLIFISIFGIGSCGLFSSDHGNNGQGRVAGKILWTETIADSLEVIGLFFPRILYNEGVLSKGFKDKKYTLSLLNTNNGKPLWTTVISEDRDKLDVKSSHVFQNMMVFASGTIVGGINLDNGAVVWQFDRWYDNSNSTMTGDGETFYYADNKQIIKGNVLTGEQELLIEMPYVDGANNYYRPQTPEIVKDTSGKSYLLFYSHLFNWNTGHLQAFMNLYDLEGKAFVYQTLLSEGTFSSSDGLLRPNSHAYHLMVVGDEGFVQIGSKIFKFDIWTGNHIWVENYPSGFDFSGFLYKEGIFLANCENTRLYSIDLNNGKILWDADGAGTSSRMFEMNGVVYFSGGGDGKLHGVDIKTGEELLLMEAPERSTNPSIWFTSRVGGTNGKLFVNTPLTAYCIQAVR